VININKRYTLILNRHYQPLAVEGVKKTLGYFVCDEGKALDLETYELLSFADWIKKHKIEDHNVTIRSEKLWVLIPEILVLNTNNQKTSTKTRIALSKRKVFERDQNRCGYCGTHLTGSMKTIDHVIPISRGGPKHDYGNVVACCFPCNSQKGNRTPEEMGWTLAHKLTNPEANLLYHVPRAKWLESWKPFLKESMSA
jgi:hypothetical protein